MPASLRFPIEESSQCAEARRAVLRMAEESGFDETRAGKAAIVVTELCTNILKHAGSGEILLQGSNGDREDSCVTLEALALDKGPGMRDVEACVEDGYSTGSSPGTGLGAIRRLSDESDFYSAPGQGTAILARWSNALKVNGGIADTSNGEPLLGVGAVCVSKRGETFCGDCWEVHQTKEMTTVLLADGLGHGYEASLASAEAVRILRNNREVQPGLLIDLVHRALRSLRGAAVSVAQIDRRQGQLTFSGLGNVSGQIYSGQRRCQHLVSVSGTAGHQTARIKEFSYPWPADGMLLMHSDGLSTSTSPEAHPALGFRDVSLIAGVLYRQYSRGHDDATVVVLRATT
jgi:anti-sigma regulatory factor (Ser/Thr protein kinase)/serine/threonine protein phosphatase PrpC